MVRIGALLEIRMGDQTISLSDWWRQDWGLKSEKYALCKTHLLRIDGKTNGVFVEVEPTVNSLEIKDLGKGFVQSSSWAHWNSFPEPLHRTLKNCLDTVVSEGPFLSDVSMVKVFATQVYFCFISCTNT